jgi:hypothetical protein
MTTPDGAAGGGQNGAGSGNQGANNNQAGSQSQGNNQGAGGSKFESFADFLKGQPEAIRSLYEEDTKGLKSALVSERDRNKTLEDQLRDAAKKADAGSEAQKLLTNQADNLAESNRKLTFMDSAHKAGVADLNLAYLAAREAGLLDKDGDCNFDKLKATHPALFAGAKAPPPAGAGAGNESGKVGSVSMNDFIRVKAGRG